MSVFTNKLIDIVNLILNESRATEGDGFEYDSSHQGRVTNLRRGCLWAQARMWVTIQRQG